MTGTKTSSLSRAHIVALCAVVGAALSTTRDAPGDAPKPAPSASASAAAATTTLTKTAGKPRHLATDDTSIYWGDGKKLLAVDKIGGAVRTVATTGSTPGHIALLGGKAYWVEGEGVYTVGKAPATTRVKDFHIPTPPGVNEPVEIEALFPSTGSHLCATIYSGTGQLPQITCFDTSKPSSGTAFDVGTDGNAPMTMDDKNVYWASLMEGDGEGVFMASYTPSAKTLGKRTKLASKTESWSGMIVNGGALFWFENAGLVSLTTSTPATRTIVAAGAKGTSLAADATHVYYLAAGKVNRVARAAGSKPQPVAGTKVEVFAIDASTIYWVEGGALVKSPKNP